MSASRLILEFEKELKRPLKEKERQLIQWIAQQQRTS